METCVGCGSPVAPTWKFCIHCGLAIDPPEAADASVAALPARSRSSSRALLFGGIGIFIVGIALLIVAIAFFAGAFR
jgi:hypothetical protein